MWNTCNNIKNKIRRDEVHILVYIIQHCPTRSVRFSFGSLFNCFGVIYDLFFLYIIIHNSSSHVEKIKYFFGVAICHPVWATTHHYGCCGSLCSDVHENRKLHTYFCFRCCCTAITASRNTGVRHSLLHLMRELLKSESRLYVRTINLKLGGGS